MCRVEHEGAIGASIVCLESESMVIVCFVPDVPLQASDTFEVSKNNDQKTTLPCFVPDMLEVSKMVR